MGSPRVLHVGEVELDLRRRELRRAGASVPVQPRVFDVLLHLVEHRDRVVTKSELLETVWSGETVVPDVLTTALHSLRRALGDDPKAPAYVRTVPRVGYQLVAPVKAASGGDFPALEARHAAFVGRRAETSLFEEMLSGRSPIQLLFVHGPPGIGKTTLLQELGYQCRKAGVEHVWLAAETAGPFPESFVRALADALGCHPSFERLRERLAANPLVVFVDDVHLLEGVDEWMRQELWPSLPSRARLVLAGRRAPSTRWRCDPAWQETARAIDLGPFDAAEARELLSKRGVAPSASDVIVRVTRGHPLALALAADLGPDERHLNLLERSDVVDALVDWFTDQIVDEARLRAFEVACLLDEVSERELAALDDPRTAAEHARWLSTLSFVTPVDGAVRVHTLVRDAVMARLARVRPHRLADLIKAAHLHWVSEIARAPDPAAKLRFTNLLVGSAATLPCSAASTRRATTAPSAPSSPPAPGSSPWPSISCERTRATRPRRSRADGSPIPGRACGPSAMLRATRSGSSSCSGWARRIARPPRPHAIPSCSASCATSRSRGARSQATRSSSIASCSHATATKRRRSSRGSSTRSRTSPSSVTGRAHLR